MAKKFDVKVIAHFKMTQEIAFQLDSDYLLQELLDCLHGFAATNWDMYIEARFCSTGTDNSDIKAEWDKVLKAVRFTFSEHAKALVELEGAKPNGIAEQKPIVSGSSVYVVKFREGFNPFPDENDKGEYYFTSVAAIYTKFTAEHIGCKLQNLWQSNVTKGSYYINTKVIIKRNPLYSKKHASQAADCNVPDELNNLSAVPK